MDQYMTTQAVLKKSDILEQQLNVCVNCEQTNNTGMIVINRETRKYAAVDNRAMELDNRLIT